MRTACRGSFCFCVQRVTTTVRVATFACVLKLRGATFLPPVRSVGCRPRCSRTHNRVCTTSTFGESCSPCAAPLGVRYTIGCGAAAHHAEPFCFVMLRKSHCWTYRPVFVSQGHGGRAFVFIVTLDPVKQAAAASR